MKILYQKENKKDNKNNNKKCCGTYLPEDEVIMVRNEERICLVCNKKCTKECETKGI